jgi:hypothetical protein
MSFPRLIPPSSPPFPSAQPRETATESDDDGVSSPNGGDAPEQSHPSAHAEELSDESDTYEAPRRLYKPPKPRRRPRKPKLPQNKPSSQASTPPTPRQTKRHTGPKSTWRSWTAADRAIATSLDQLTSQDLSLHLYNAHALKQRAQLARQDLTIGDRDERLWEPPRIWTAWPLGAEDVPRERDGAWEEDGTVGGSRKRKRDPRRAREDIEDILVGVVLKTARERLREEYPPGHPAESLDSHFNSSSDSTSSFSSRSSEVSAPERSSPSNSSTSSSSPSTLSQPPTPLLDDALAHSILHPTLHHTLTTLDRLLAGLHSARQASLRLASDSASGTDGEYSTHGSDDSSAPKHPSKSLRRRGYESRSRSRSKPRPAKAESKAKGKGKGKAKSRSPITADEADELHSSAEPISPSPKTTRSRSRSRPSRSPHSRAKVLQRRQRRLGLRDWSDVLGIAALHGWDGAVIDAAAKRCAALFGEGMDFRVLQAEGEGEGEGEVVRYRPEVRS